jgi:[acyl-carrier-protein] S-malonyltransferase
MTTAVLICPGRGTYTKTELGYLRRHFGDRALLAAFDRTRDALGQETLSALDGAAGYSVAKHTRGDNASALIYAATLGDFRAIDREKVEIVAVTGNSMGWYSALACAGALTAEAGFEVVNTMGTLMQEALIGGQLVHPHMGEDWRPDPARKAGLMAKVAAIGARPGHVLALSIDLGGMLVLAGNDAGLKAFEAEVPPEQGRFPMRLSNHAAFHTALQAPVAEREFAPDLFIVTGPGTTLGGAVAQSLILADWRGMGSKTDFQTRQQTAPLLVSLGMEDQRATVTKGDAR